MKRYLLVAALLAVVGCSDPADSPECRKWQKDTLSLASLLNDRDVALSSTIDERPDGCPIPW
jgi:hypothetical protein